ncbi:ATP-dependent helicase [Candidatus Gracilibacteria bacterium]|nr:ATP-dependent helicase [Candidatus Gracilibacteria bacterium]
MNFSTRYAALNPAQRQAVDTIEGPVLVVAGPGSGKTELLALRIANILQKTDALPSAILCLTFTNNAAQNMRQRLIGLIGREAYKVAIHTFHSFGAEIIAQNPEYFYQGAAFTAADKLAQIQILDEIFQKLPLNDPLSKLHPEKGFTLLDETLTRIAELKQAAITPEALAANLQNSKNFLDQAAPFVQEIGAQRISAKTLHLFDQLLLDLQNLPEADLKQDLVNSLALAISEAHAGSKPNTKPLTAWKNDYTKKDHNKKTIFADQDKIDKLLSLQKVYKTYQEKLYQKGLFDFADMLLDTLNAAEQNPELRYNLQEKYQYLLVDEFQDTSGVQLKLLDTVLDSEINEGRPNILAVGDDDQSIFKFQGANIENILTFHQKYRDPAVIVLDQNYRSNQPILDFVREIIIQAQDRLENRLEGVTKILTAAGSALCAQVQEHLFQTDLDELTWITQQISATQIPLSEIAIIAPKNKQLERMAKILAQKNIPINYERQQNLLEKPLIKEILEILRFLANPTEQSHLATILTFPFWQLDRIKIWQLSVKAYRERKLWLEIMLEDPALSPTAQFLIELSQKALTHTAEEIIDLITHGPFRQHHFHTINTDYLENLKTLDSFIKAIRASQGQKPYNTKELLSDFLELHKSYGIPLNYTLNLQSSPEAVHLLTAHGAKGLEFTEVFVLHCQDEIWCPKPKPKQISFTKNLKISAENDTIDDNIRLLYVALTRAKTFLHLTSHQQSENAKQSNRLRFLPEQEPQIKTVLNPEQQTRLSLNLNKPLIQTLDESELLKSLVKNYTLSATHFNHFLDLTYHGPTEFLQNQLLRFPQKMHAAASYGSAIHDALHKFQSQFRHQKTLPTAQTLIENFEQALKNQRLNHQDFQKYLEKGSADLTKFYAHNHQNFSPHDLAEFDFREEGVKIADAQIVGKVDRIHLDPNTQTALVIDYKTGKPFRDWNAYDEKNQRKAWEYKNQLIFYKLLLENSRTFGDKYQVKKGKIEFIEPFKDQNIALTLEITDHDLQQTKKLIEIIYRKITTLDFPDTTKYGNDFGATQLFINDLLDGHI